MVLEDILDLIVSRLPPEVFIDHHTTATYKPNLDLPHIKHMYLKFKYVFLIQLCSTSADFSTPQLFTGVLTPYTVKKHTIPGSWPRLEETGPSLENTKQCCATSALPSAVMRIVLTPMSVISTCVWLWGVASALTLLVSHVLTSEKTLGVVLQRDLLVAWPPN